MDIQSAQYVSELASRTTSNQSTKSTNPYSSDMFLQLLAAQLQYQNPMESMDSSQMIVQMSQFATIEQLNQLNSQFGMFMEMSTIQDGAALVGKEVRIGLDDETTIVGIVDKVGFSSQGTIVQIDGKYYDLWRVIEIGEPGKVGEPTGGEKPEVEKPEGETPEVPGTTEKPEVETPETTEKPEVETPSNGEAI